MRVVSLATMIGWHAPSGAIQFGVPAQPLMVCTKVFSLKRAKPVVQAGGPSAPRSGLDYFIVPLSCLFV